MEYSICSNTKCCRCFSAWIICLKKKHRKLSNQFYSTLQHTVLHGFTQYCYLTFCQRGNLLQFFLKILLHIETGFCWFAHLHQNYCSLLAKALNLVKLNYSMTNTIRQYTTYLSSEIINNINIVIWKTDYTYSVKFG